MKITTLNDAKMAGRKLGESIVNKDAALDAEFIELVKNANQVNNAEDIEYETIAALLSMPESQFSILAPIFLEELEKSYNSTNNQMLILRAFNVTGKSVEDVREEYLSLCQALDDTMIGFSDQKISFLKQIMGLFYNAICDADGVEKSVLLVPIELCNENAKLPQYAYATDSGLDVYAIEDIEIKPSETKLIKTGLKVAIPKGYELQVRPKSGRCLKSKMRVANTPGTIDAGYREEIGIIIDNIEPFIKSATIDENGCLHDVIYGSTYYIFKGEKIAQLVLAKVPKVAWLEVKSINEIDNDGRNGGFGSTGNF